MTDPVLGLSSPAKPRSSCRRRERRIRSRRFGIDLGDPAAVDAAHDEAVRRGLRVVYPLTDEPWGARRFFVEDAGDTIVNVLAHIP